MNHPGDYRGVRDGQYGRVRPRGSHRFRTAGIVLIALVIVLTGLDFGARAVAENLVASQIKDQGFPDKPSVSIAGFPFLAQLITRDFKEVRVSSGSLTEGPLEIASVRATMTGVHVNSSFNGGAVDRISGTIDVTFPALASAMTAEAGPLGQLSGGPTLAAAGPHEVKATLDLAVTSRTVVWRVTRAGHNVINIHLLPGGGLPSGLLSSAGDINVPLPSLPAGLSIQDISVTPSGLIGTVTGQNLTFGR
jgi:hypothetical protein